ncbi:MAG TPA: MFS transporter, partial [Myxococcales bacterium]|nr:MFS transporter [Myxococcales bacterium]
MVEGAFAELVGACTAGGVITAWALYLDLPPFLIGLLGALPFSAQLVQLPASWITRRLGSKRAALWTIGIGRQCVLPLAALPFLPV